VELFFVNVSRLLVTVDRVDGVLLNNVSRVPTPEPFVLKGDVPVGGFKGETGALNWPEYCVRRDPPGEPDILNSTGLEVGAILSG
jgi:hypothetical protein